MSVRLIGVRSVGRDARAGHRQAPVSGRTPPTADEHLFDSSRHAGVAHGPNGQAYRGEHPADPADNGVSDARDGDNPESLSRRCASTPQAAACTASSWRSGALCAVVPGFRCGSASNWRPRAPSADGARLDLNVQPGIARCRTLRRRVRADVTRSCCAPAAVPTSKSLAGRELRILSMEVS